LFYRKQFISVITQYIFAAVLAPNPDEMDVWHSWNKDSRLDLLQKKSVDRSNGGELVLSKIFVERWVKR